MNIPFDVAGNESAIFEQLKAKSEENGVLLTLVSIKDLARDRFHAPRGVSTVREAVRDFKHLCESDPHITKDLHDYELYQVGLFNPVDGSSISIGAVRLARGLDFKKA